DPGHRAGGADEFAEGAVLVVGGNGAVGCVHQGHDVAVAVVAIEVGPGVGAGWHRHGDQSTHPTRALRTPAYIRAPHKGSLQGGRLVHNRHEIPSVVEVAIGVNVGENGTRVGRDELLDPPAHVVV